jgi:hypothetical protein
VVAVIAGVLLAAQQHRDEHRRSMIACSRPMAVAKSAAPAAIMPMTRKVGRNMLAAISLQGRQPWPMRRIQATMGTVMITAIASSATAGASAWSCDEL